MKSAVLVLSIQLFTTSLLIAQTAGWSVYDTSDGLPHQKINTVAIDSSGNIWAGTENGLARISSNGTITVFDTLNSDVPDNKINQLAVDHDNLLWVGTDEGLSTYGNNTWTYIDTINGAFPFWIKSLGVTNTGNIWIGNSNGAKYYDGSSWTTYNTSNSTLTSNNIEDFTFTNDGLVWIGSSGLFSYNGIDFILYDESNSGLLDDDIDVAAAEGNAVWVGSWDGLSHYDGTGSWSTYTTGGGNDIKYIAALEIDNNGHKWIGMLNGYGLVEYDGTDFTRHHIPDLENGGTIFWEAVLDLAEDNNNIIWIGTVENGLYSFEPGVTQTQVAHDNENEVFEIFPTPFSEDIHLTVNISEPGIVNISLFDITGKLHEILSQSHYKKGRHSFHHQLNHLARGVYLLKLQVNGKVITRKVIKT